MSLSILYFMSAVAGTCVGVAGPLTPLLLKSVGANEMQVGLAASIMFASIAGGALLMGPIADRQGPKMGAILGASLAAVAMFLTPAAITVEQFFAVRAVEGLGVGALVVCLEAAMNRSTEKSNRGAALGLYSLMFASGVSGGSAIAAFSSAALLTPFLAAGSLMSLGAGFMAFFMRNSAHVDCAGSAVDREGLFKLVWAPLAAVGCYATIEGAMLSLFPVYLSLLNFSASEIGLIFTIYGGAAIVGPLGAGAASDFMPRERLMLASGALLAISIALLWRASPTFAPIAAASALMGVGAGALYPLGLGLIGDRVPTARLGAANSLFTSSYGAGSIVGPLIAGSVMRWFGDVWFFAPLLMIAAAFVLLVTLDPPVGKAA